MQQTFKQSTPSPRLHLAPGDADIWQNFTRPHTVVVTAGQGRIITQDGDDQTLSEGDVTTVHAGRYRVSNSSKQTVLSVLLLAA